MKKIFFLLFFITTGSQAVTDGSLDTTFGLGTGSLGPAGTITTTIGTIAQATATYIQADGKIVMGGFSDVGSAGRFTITRYNTDGSLDTTFNGTGIVQLSAFSAGSTDQITGIAVQADGKIVAVGTTHPVTGGPNHVAIARLTASGILDTSFNGTGTIIAPRFGTGGSDSNGDVAQAVVIDLSNNIVIAGYSDSASALPHFALTRYTPSGALDTAFNPGGGPTFNNTAGTVVTSFAQNNSSQDLAFAIALQSDGSIIAGGYSTIGSGQHFALARYSSSGILDTSFGGPTDFANIPGTVVTSFNPPSNSITGQIAALLIQPNGLIIGGGFGDDLSGQTAIMLARYTTSGALDTTFTGQAPTVRAGTVITELAVDDDDEVHSLALQSDGKIVVGGSSDFFGTSSFMVGRYLTNGTIDTTFGGNAIPGFTVTLFGSFMISSINAIALQQNGDIIGAGFFNNNVINTFAGARYVVNNTPLTPTTILHPINLSTVTPTFVVSGTAQSPSIVDITFTGPGIVNNKLAVYTNDPNNTWSFTAVNFPPGIFTISAVARYHDDGHVNLASAITTFTVIGCTNPTSTTPVVILYDQLYPTS